MPRSAPGGRTEAESRSVGFPGAEGSPGFAQRPSGAGCGSGAGLEDLEGIPLSAASLGNRKMAPGSERPPRSAPPSGGAPLGCWAARARGGGPAGRAWLWREPRRVLSVLLLECSRSPGGGRRKWPVRRFGRCPGGLAGKFPRAEAFRPGPGAPLSAGPPGGLGPRPLPPKIVRGPFVAGFWLLRV